jgi:branched-chain amino acid transport system permease protein
MTTTESETPSEKQVRNQKKSVLDELWPLLALAVPVVVLALVLSAVSPVMARVVTDALVKLIVVIGLYIFIGNSGILSFGHGAFMVVGGYASAWFTMTPMFKKIILPDMPVFMRMIEMGPVEGAALAIALTTLVALVIGIPLMRLAGIAASIATFAFFSVVVVIYNNWSAWTKGTASLVGLPVYANTAICLTVALVALLVAYMFQKSRYGLLLRATREDEVAGRAAGISVERMRLLAFVLSAAVVTVGGIMLGHFNGALTTTSNVYLKLTFITLAMLVIGGMRSLAGAVIGVAIVTTVAEFLRQLERGIDVGEWTMIVPSGSGQVALGITMLLVLVFRPDGVMRGQELTPPRWLTRLLEKTRA